MPAEVRRIEVGAASEERWLQEGAFKQGRNSLNGESKGKRSGSRSVSGDEKEAMMRRWDQCMECTVR